MRRAIVAVEHCNEAEAEPVAAGRPLEFRPNTKILRNFFALQNKRTSGKV